MNENHPNLERNVKDLLQSIKPGTHYNCPRISSEYPDCSLPLTFDTNNICAYQCQYCFAAYSKSNNPALKGDFAFKPINVKYFCEMLGGKHPENPYYRNFIKYRFPLHIGGLSDCFDATELKLGVTYELLKTLVEYKYPTAISTKGTIMVNDEKYYNLLKESAKNKNFIFQFSIITNDDEKAKQIEKYAPTTTQRLEAMKKLSDLGYWTVLRLRPFIIGLSDDGLEELLTRAKEAGARGISTEFFCVDMRCGKDVIRDRYKFISDLLGFDLVEFYEKLSPSSRGTYRRLNWRVKEHYVKRMYIKCKELGLQFNTSDPDFKELNMSGSCCCLPETRQDYDSELVNWSRGQLTYQLKELRKRYWASGGKDKFLTWDMVKDAIPHNWMNEHKYYGDSIKCWNSDWAKDKMGHIHEFLDTWNNLRSSGNIYNYFDGVLVPSYLDENKNIVYYYRPRPYEKRWMKEGIL